MLLRGLVMVVMALSSLAAATLPDGFSEVQVAGGLDPTGMVFAPDGRLFIAEKPGRVRVVDRGALVAQPFLDIAAQVDNYNERGLVGIALHPQFSTNGWVYVYYTARSSAHNRVSRFTASGNVAVAGTERIVLDLETLGAGNHNGGGLGFGPDGRLYIAQGENTVATNAQQLDTRLGKVLRLKTMGAYRRTIRGILLAIPCGAPSSPSVFAIPLPCPCTPRRGRSLSMTSARGSAKRSIDSWRVPTMAGQCTKVRWRARRWRATAIPSTRMIMG